MSDAAAWDKPFPKPDWWDWEVFVTDHAADRMRHRDFDSAEVLAMMDDATELEFQTN